MLSWLTGSKGSEESTIANCDSFIEAPETPAPVFAVRAFKHAIFGTPRPSDGDYHGQFASESQKEMGHGKDKATEDLFASRPKFDEIKRMTLPDGLPLSPSKPNGILMTPGTTRRNKTVTFGAQVVDNEDKKTSRSGLPNTCPGKFPSPWTPKVDINSLGEPLTGSQKRTRLTQTLHDVRDSSKNQRLVDRVAVKAKDDMDLTLDMSEPRAQSGKYWKREYEAYAEKTQREVKKLLAKQKLAKDFAKDKDAEVLSLNQRLRKETEKAELLEARTRDLEKEILALKKNLELENSARPSGDVSKTHNDAAALRLENWKLREDLERAQTKGQSIRQSPRKRPAPTVNADIWADAVQSSPFVVDAGDKSMAKTSPSPLASRNINTLQSSQRSSHSKLGRRLDSTPKRNVTRSIPRGSRDSQILPDDSFDFSLALPQPSPELINHTPSQSAKRSGRSARKSATKKTVDELLVQYESPIKPLIMSSPPPKFDRLAIPMGMPSTNSGFNSTRQQQQQQQQTHRKKASLAESFGKAADLSVEQIEPGREGFAVPSHDDGIATEKGDADEDKAQRKQLSEEKRLAALERIAARRAGKTKST